jgi:predicted  nucleic acid-binding Zn-ribbon protein
MDKEDAPAPQSFYSLGQRIAPRIFDWKPYGLLSLRGTVRLPEYLPHSIANHPAIRELQPKDPERLEKQLKAIQRENEAAERELAAAQEHERHWVKQRSAVQNNIADLSQRVADLINAELAEPELLRRFIAENNLGDALQTECFAVTEAMDGAKDKIARLSDMIRNLQEDMEDTVEQMEYHSAVLDKLLLLSSKRVADESEPAKRRKLED